MVYTPGKPSPKLQLSVPLFQFSFRLADTIEQERARVVTLRKGEQTDINPIASCGYGTEDYSSLATAGGSYSTSKFTRVMTSLEQNTDITIVTAEGDKVTLSSDLQFQTTHATYEALVRTKTNFVSLHSESIGVDASRELSVSVDGDLSKEELRDINKALRIIEEIMRGFLSGDIDHLMSKAMKISKLKSISSLEANLQYERSMSIDQQFVKEVAFAPTEVTGETAPRGDTDTVDHVDKLTNELVRAVQDSGIKPAKLFKPVKRLFSHFLKALSETENGPADSPKLQMAKLIKSHLLEKIKHLDENEHDAREHAMPSSGDERDDHEDD